MKFQFLKPYYLIGIVFILQVFSSCTPYAPSAITPNNNNISYSVRKADSKIWEIPNPKVFQVPMVATHEVTGNRVKGVATIKTNEGTVEIAKNLAVVDAVSKVENCDQLVNPLFSSTIENGVIKAEVTGYPARLKEVRSFQVSDTSLLLAIHDIETKLAFNDSKVSLISTSSIAKAVEVEKPVEIAKTPEKPLPIQNVDSGKKSSGLLTVLISIAISLLVIWGLSSALSSN